RAWGGRIGRGRAPRVATEPGFPKAPAPHPRMAETAATKFGGRKAGGQFRPFLACGGTCLDTEYLAEHVGELGGPTVLHVVDVELALIAFLSAVQTGNPLLCVIQIRRLGGNDQNG